MRETNDRQGWRGLACALLFLPLTAAARPLADAKTAGGIEDLTVTTRTRMISPWAFIPWSYGTGIGLGGRYSYHQIVLGVDPRWTFHFSKTFDLYGKLGLGYAFAAGGAFNGTGYYGSTYLSGHPYSRGYVPPAHAPWLGGVYINAAAGGEYWLTRDLALRLEVGSWGLRAGVGLAI